ncbi:MAG TPA: HlyD family type I secretion periplasmic adaptor subunit [Methylibium sp.]|nr:HlyD family type I secretion periplasmic adaptor subunit [Methylibium sp.]
MSAVPVPVATVEPRPADEADVRALLARLRRAGLVAVLVWLAMMVLWSVWAPISGAVVAGGLVKVEANRQTISHRDGGTVSKVLVREGQQVKKGDTLILLEDARIDSSVDLLVAQFETEKLRKSRLEAEVAFRTAWAPTAEQRRLAAQDARVREALAREASTFEARRRTALGQMDSARGQRRDADNEVKARLRDRVATAEALRLLNEELASNEQLLEQNFVNRTRVLQFRRGVSEYESRIQTNEAELAKAQQRVSELDGRLQSLQDAYKQTAAEELREVTGRVIDLEERLRASRDTAGRQTVTAPADGRLIELRVNTVGSAIGPREPIVDLVPADAPLVVEVRVGADAIGDLHPGLDAEVQLLPYKQRSTDLIDGKVLRVSADALTEQRSGVPYFTVQVELSKASLAQASADHGSEMAVLPGMAAEVYIKTSKRTPLDFLLSPLTSGIRRSFREH